MENNELSLNLLKTIDLIKDIKKNVTQLEIHKLLYIAFDIYYKKFNKNLFEEEFEAWMYGPVIKEIYYYPKKISKSNLNYLDNIIENKRNLFKWEKNEKEYLVCALKYIIKNTTSQKLVEWTHEDKSWLNTLFFQKISKYKIKNNKQKQKWEKLIENINYR